MKNIPEYLKDNPDYYINGGEEILTNLTEIKSKIDNILDNISLFYLENKIEDGNNYGVFIFRDKSGDEKGYFSYNFEKNSIIGINSGILGSGVSYLESIGKNMYILMAIEAYKLNMTLNSDYIYSLSINGKYLWNSLVNLGIVEYDEDMKRFKFINNMLEDYFPKQIKKRTD